MRNIKLVLEYDGGAFSGFQKQRPGTLTVQSLLEEKISVLVKHPVKLTGAGRTDAGVHATGQAANFKTGHRISLDVLRRALNASLRPSLLVREACEVPADFHARFSARSRVYQYLLLNREFHSPLASGWGWLIREKLDLDSMKAAARLLEGKHDFSSFKSGKSDRDNPECTIRRIALTREKPGRRLYWHRLFTGEETILIEVESDSFLRGMVRMIVGTLVRIGLKRTGPGEIPDILKAGNPALGGPSAPAHGLCLVEVKYPGEICRLEKAPD
jgi:tRNA pseudouridine38-40 synthase